MSEYAFSKKTTWGELSDSDAKLVNKKLEKIQRLVALTPYPVYKYLAFVAFVVVSVCVGIVLGEFWYIVLFTIIFWPFLTGKDTGKTTDGEKAAYEIAHLMAECMYIIEYPPDSTLRDPSRLIGVFPNDKLYSDFVSMFPSCRSLKLRFIMKAY